MSNKAGSRISRRTMIQAAGAFAATYGLTFAAPSVLRGEEAGSKLIIGSGEYKYECTHGWLAPPDDIIYGDTHGACTDSQGRIYIAHTVHPGSPKSDTVLVFDPNGKFIKSFGSEFVGGAHGLDIRREPDGHEYIYHCDIKRSHVVKTDLDGQVLWQKGREPLADVYQKKDARGRQIKYVPTNVAFAPNGDFYVGDGYGSSYILQYNLKGEFVRLIGKRGSKLGELNNTHGLWVDDRDAANPTLAVADRGNHRIQYFTLDGKPLRLVTNGMRKPCHFKIDHQRSLLLVPDLDRIVTILDKDDKVVAALGDGKGGPDLRNVPRAKFPPGKFVHPHAAAFINDKSDIVVAEWVPIGRVTHLRKLG